MFKKKTDNNNEADWKEKAKIRRQENTKLKKKTKDIEKSRNRWKTKALKYQQEIERLTEELKKND
ncbi:MAG TPA: hypothetical protein VF820_04850 [Patescibacteria group bacterium]